MLASDGNNACNIGNEALTAQPDATVNITDVELRVANGEDGPPLVNCSLVMIEPPKSGELATLSSRPLVDKV